jgi:hypothetical protein
MPGENNPPSTSQSAEDRLLDTLDGIIKNVASPEVFEAQTILLRRLALQGGVITSRIPAPRNVTEIGGYINLLESLNQTEMRSQMLAGILSVAGPTPPLGWLSSKPPLAFASFSNDRPEGPSQATIPLTFRVRTDFSNALMSGIKWLRDQGCALPILSSMAPLPPAVPGAQTPNNALPHLGRTLDVVPATALRDPATDPLAIARPQGTAEPFKLVARVLSPGGISVAAADWEVLTCEMTKCTPSSLNGQFVPVAPVFAGAGFIQASPVPQPTTLKSTEWARYTNITGLVVGVTKLGDELSLLYSVAEISASVFASRLNWLWDGTSFIQD